MRSDIIAIDNQGNGFDEAMAQTKKTAAFRGISHKDEISLQLLTEETLSMIRSVTGKMEASFWIDCEGRRFELNVTTNAALDKEQRALLISSSSSRKNEAAKSFLGRLRDAFEEAMASEADQDYFELPVELQADLSGRMFVNPEWDRYEKSVLLRLADNVKIGIRGKTVSMTVIKTFPE